MRYLVIWAIAIAALIFYSARKHWDMISVTLGQAWSSTLHSVEYIAIQGLVILFIIFGIVWILRGIFR